jgi:hypothetical protein
VWLDGGNKIKKGEKVGVFSRVASSLPAAKCAREEGQSEYRLNCNSKGRYGKEGEGECHFLIRTDRSHIFYILAILLTTLFFYGGTFLVKVVWGHKRGGAKKLDKLLSGKSATNWIK